MKKMLFLSAILMVLILGLGANSTPRSVFADGPVATHWENTGPYGGVITALAMSPSDPRTLFATTAWGYGVFKSIDGGATWRLLNDFAYETAYSIAIDPNDSNTIFIGSWKAIYKSSDGGDTWRAVFSLDRDANGYEVNTLSIAPSQSSIIYAYLEEGGLLKSIDGGETWNMLGDELSSVTSLAVSPQNPNIVYAGIYTWDRDKAGVYQSVDGGIHWQPINNGLKDRWGRNVSVKILLFDPQDSSIIYAGTCDGVYKNIDGGAHWTKTNMQRCIDALGIDPENPEVIFAGTGSGVYKSLNGGATWSFSNQGLDYPDITALVVVPGGNDIIVGTEGAGLFKSSDGGNSWHASSQGITSISPCHHCIIIDPQHPSTIYVGTFETGIYKSEDGGLNWMPINSGLRNLRFRTLAIDPKNSQHLFAMSNYTVYESVDGGAHWQPINTELNIGDVLSVTVAPTSPPSLFAGTKDGIFRSQDGGHTWSRSSGDQVDWVWEIAVDPGNPATMYAASDSYAASDVYKSVDAGNSWSRLYTYFGAANAVAVDPANSQRIYAANWGGVYKSEDGGDTWKQMNNGLDPHSYIRMALDSSASNTLYAATGSQIYQSIDGAQSWSDMDFPLNYERLFITTITADARSSGVVYAGVWGRGVYARRQVILNRQLHLPLFMQQK